MSKCWLICFSIFALLSGCRFQEIELIAIKSVTYKDFDNMLLQLEIEAAINNPNSQNITLRDGELKLHFNGKQIGSVMQMEPVKLKAGKTDTYLLHVTVRLENIPDNLNALFRLLMNHTSELSLSGTVNAKMALWNKTVVINKSFP
ncbi:MAG: LEA type 2 family protein [Bacteroidales bacterium]|nr:LEA type 2 family protein [Bacteroidales bacterium]